LMAGNCRWSSPPKFVSDQENLCESIKLLMSSLHGLFTPSVLLFRASADGHLHRSSGEPRLISRDCYGDINGIRGPGFESLAHVSRGRAAWISGQNSGGDRQNAASDQSADDSAGKHPGPEALRSKPKRHQTHSSREALDHLRKSRCRSE